jgi:hypothetical protein
MAILVGVVLGLLVGLSTTLVGMDRDRALYPAILVVIASYFSLFAVLGGSSEAIALETVVALIFVAAAFAGFRMSLWLVVAAIAAHGLTDPFHGRIIENAGVPAWWPAFCASIDVVLAAYLGWMLASKRVASKPSE